MIPRRNLILHLILLTGGLVVAIWPARTYAQISATVEFVSGEVLVSVQGSAPSLITIGVALNAGDTLRTGPGSEVVIRLPDGSTLQLGENSSLDISTLTQSLQTGARTSFFRLLFGKVRSIISDDYKTPGSEFVVETPNALAGVKFTVYTVAYDPIKDETEVTTELGEVLLTVLRRVDCPSASVGSGDTAIVQGNQCSFVFRTGQRPPEEPQPQELPLPEELPLPQEQPQQLQQRRLLENLRTRAAASTSSSVPISTAGGEAPQTSSPPPSNERINPTRQSVPVRIIIEIQKTLKR